MMKLPKAMRDEYDFTGGTRGKYSFGPFPPPDNKYHHSSGLTMEYSDPTVAMNPRNPDTDKPEDPFRTKVRDILGLSWDTRDDKIFDKLRDLKKDLADFESSFKLYDRASMALMQAYKKAHPNVPENVWPDASRVNAWAASLLIPSYKDSSVERDVILNRNGV